MHRYLLPLLGAALLAPTAQAAPALYTIDPTHTFPSFEADHMGLSVWRGKFNKSTGTVTLDKTAGSGEVDITIDMDSIDFGLDAMNAKARGDGMFDTTQFPLATYKGQLAGFVNGAPTQVVGRLTMHGITRPLTLQIQSFKCRPHPMYRRDWCGADALATFQRDDFGVDTGKEYGFKMDVTLRIQVEAVKTTD